MDATRSVLDPDPQPLALPVLVALMLHLGVAAAIVCAGFLVPGPKPMVEPPAMEVAMMVLPRATSMPERAQHVARPSGEQSTEPAPPAPPVQSDLSYKTPDAPKTAGTETKDKQREDEIRKLLALQQLDDDSPEGKTDRQATDPDSTSDEKIDAGGAAGHADPELAKYLAELKKLFHASFHPLPSIVAANPDIHCSLVVTVDPSTGAVTGYEWKEKSGNDSYDGAAERAVQAVTTVPLPPEKYASLASQGYEIHYP